MPVQLRSCSEIGDSQRGRQAVNMEFEGSTTLETVTRHRLVKTQHTGKMREVRAIEMGLTVWN
jgi:hypothetical protein